VRLVEAEHVAVEERLVVPPSVTITYAIAMRRRRRSRADEDVLVGQLATGARHSRIDAHDARAVPLREPQILQGPVPKVPSPGSNPTSR